MTDPLPPPDEHSHRARAVQRLRAAIQAALRDGQEACRRDPRCASLAEPLLKRLEQIGRELDHMEAFRTGLGIEETHPFWIDLLNEVGAVQTPCGKSPPPANSSR